MSQRDFAGIQEDPVSGWPEKLWLSHPWEFLECLEQGGDIWIYLLSQKMDVREIPEH